LEDRQLLLLDAGAEWQCYASDVTRTFPISGYWTEEAKAIYDIVDDMQTQCIQRFRPGASFRDIYLLAHFIAVTGLMNLGILHNGTREEILKAGTATAFFPHGLGVS
jgi:Xaa-Pro dipeptidase